MRMTYIESWICRRWVFVGEAAHYAHQLPQWGRRLATPFWRPIYRGRFGPLGSRVRLWNRRADGVSQGATRFVGVKRFGMVVVRRHTAVYTARVFRGQLSYIRVHIDVPCCVILIVCRSHRLYDGVNAVVAFIVCRKSISSCLMWSLRDKVRRWGTCSCALVETV